MEVSTAWLPLIYFSHTFDHSPTLLPASTLPIPRRDSASSSPADSPVSSQQLKEFTHQACDSLVCLSLFLSVTTALVHQTAILKNTLWCGFLRTTPPPNLPRLLVMENAALDEKSSASLDPSVLTAACGRPPSSQDFFSLHLAVSDVWRQPSWKHPSFPLLTQVPLNPSTHLAS